MLPPPAPVGQAGAEGQAGPLAGARGPTAREGGVAAGAQARGRPRRSLPPYARPSPPPTPMSKSSTTWVGQQEEDPGAGACSANLSAQARVPRGVLACWACSFAGVSTVAPAKTGTFASVLHPPAPRLARQAHGRVNVSSPRIAARSPSRVSKLTDRTPASAVSTRVPTSSCIERCRHRCG